MFTQIIQNYYRTGTEEQKTERGRLIQEIIQVLETERVPINDEIGAEVDKLPSEATSRRNEKVAADKNRESVLEASC